MIRNAILFLLVSLHLVCCPLQALALISSSDITYVGAFRMPTGVLGGSSSYDPSLARGGHGMAYNPANNSLIMMGRYSEGPLAVEVSIPTPSTSTSLSSLPRATVVQTPWDITGGELGCSKS